MSPLPFNFALGYAIKGVQVDKEDLNLNGTHQFLVYVGGVNILGGRRNTIRKTQKLWLGT